MSERVEFKRNIGLFMAVMIGIGAMMGPGIFALPGEVAHMLGPAGILTYLIMGIVTIFTALNYAELGAAMPIAGGGYSFASRSLPRPIAFLTGWFFWIGNIAACAMYAVIFALTLQEWFFPGANVALVCLVVTVGFGLINLRGMSEAIMVVTAMNLIELAVLLVVACLGAAHVEAPNLQPFAPHGWSPLLAGMSLIYVSYVGFELITVAAEEIKDPGRVIPRAILITLGVGIVIYVVVVFVMMGSIHHTDLAGSSVPFIYMADKLFGGWGRWAAVLATVMASLSAFAVTLGASARVLYALGRDGHFPHALTRLHTRFRTPHIALLVCSVCVVAFAASGVVKFVASVADFGFLMGLGIVNYSVISLTRRKPNLRRPFRPGFYPWIPILGVVTTWGFVPFLEARTLVAGAALTAISFLIYLLRPTNRAELTTAARQLDGLVRRLLARRRKKMRVLIIDGGTLGQNIARRLLAHDEARLMFRTSEHQITFVEADEGRCADLQTRFGVPIYRGDGTKREVLEQVGPAEIDVVIAASDDDGRNVIAALQAKQLGMARVFAIVQDPDYLPLLEKEGVVAISAPWATAALVEDHLDRPGVAELFEIGSGVASLIGVIVPENAKVSGSAIRDLAIPKACVVAAVIRGREFVVPRGDTQILAGDEVVFVGPAAAIRDAGDLLRLT